VPDPRPRCRTVGVHALLVAASLVAGCSGRTVAPREVEPPGTAAASGPIDAAPADAATLTPADDLVLPGTRQVTTSTSISVLDPVKFLGASARLDPSSLPMLDAIATTLLGDPAIRALEVQAYGDDAPPEHQQQLGTQRALAIVAYLVYRGVPRGRLDAVGLAGAPAVQGVRTAFLIIRD